jgi:hypothetical protein
MPPEPLPICDPMALFPVLQRTRFPLHLNGGDGVQHVDFY